MSFVSADLRHLLSQLCVNVAVSVMGPPIVIEAGLVVPEKEPVPLPVQLVKLWPMACAAIVQVRATDVQAIRRR